ncbi:MAG: fumarylacetoacetate hydrolase family protein [Alphaproteobacteria bacterium]|nr:fumarylacetoacetate hydrolase family protein [Alphaproteobacteria bacterium]
MAALMFPATPPVTLAVAGSDARIPVHRVYCAGQNYVAHAREMGGDPDKQELFFFDKPADSVVPVPNGGCAVPYPIGTEALSQEIELVLVIGKEGENIAEAQALDHIFGYAAAIDLTRRDIQSRLKKMSLAYDMAKAFDNCAPVAEIQPAARIGHPSRGRIWIAVNGKILQDSDISDLIYSVPRIVAKLSSYVRLRPGDVVYTGTPSGIGVIKRGDVLEGGVDGVGTIKITIS